MKTWSFSPKKSDMRIWWLTLCLACAALPAFAQINMRKALLSRWPDGAGVSVQALTTGKATVLLTLATECPICQKYAGKLDQLVQDYPDITFIGVYTKWEDTALIQPFIDGYGMHFSMVIDTRHQLIKQLKTDVTPEVFLVSPAGEILYRGCINDWFVSLGKYRSVVTAEYLRDAIEAYLNGQPIALRQTKAIGCVFKP